MADARTVRAIHNAAMAQADLADAARHACNLRRCREHLAVAYGLERAAAEATPAHAQPTRAILLRSAATLARACGWHGEMRDLCKAVTEDRGSPWSVVLEARELLAGRAA